MNVRWVGEKIKTGKDLINKEENPVRLTIPKYFCFVQNKTGIDAVSDEISGKRRQSIRMGTMHLQFLRWNDPR